MLSFGIVGLVVPAILTAVDFLPGKRLENLPFWLWPSSQIFMTLDHPAHARLSTIIFVYTTAFLENSVVYATAGALLWPMAHLVSRYRHRHKKPSASSR
jgi:hypothetical protein